MTTPVLSPQILSLGLASLLLVGLGGGYEAYRLTSAQQNMNNVVKQHDQTINQLSKNLKDAQEKYSDLQGEMKFTKDRLGTTQAALSKAQQSSAQFANQQKTVARVWGDQIGQLQQKQESTEGTLGSLSSDVEGVKSELSSTNDQLNSTKTDLQGMVGDLGVQSGLIARNHTEIEELRALGERDYYEFDLGKSKQPQRVGNIAISLKKADAKRQRFTINLISDDRTIEKKDKTLNEPVQFYQTGFHQASEIVVNQIKKDRIAGYVSVPKKREGRSTLSEAGSPSSKPRS